MKGRVDIVRSQSELVAVRVQHEGYIEEHPGVANRNKSRLRRNQPVIELECTKIILATLLR